MRKGGREEMKEKRNILPGLLKKRREIMDAISDLKEAYAHGYVNTEDFLRELDFLLNALVELEKQLVTYVTNMKREEGGRSG